MIARKLAWVLAACALTFAAGVQAADPPDRYGDVSQYRRFLIYPHQQRGFEALERGDEATAIREFEHARALAVHSVGTALDLAAAYQRFGKLDPAREVLVQQLLSTPDDPRLVRALQSLDASVAKIDCSRNDSHVCRAKRGYQQLRDGHLPQAEKELAAPAFAASPEGISLRRALAQRAIHLGDMDRAARQFEVLERMGQLGHAEREQWFNVLIALDRPQRARQLQESGRLDTTTHRLALAQLLARRGDLQVLAGYLRSGAPAFDNARQEAQWIDMLKRVARQQPNLLRDYRPRTDGGRMRHARLSLQQAIDGQDWERASRLLERLPPSRFLDPRFELALRTGRFDQALAIGRRLDRPGKGRLDALSYRLMQAGGERQATRWLLQAYPFPDDPHHEALMARLALLAWAHPQWIGEQDRQRLRQDRAAPSRQAGQLRILVALRDCAGLRAMVGRPDMPSPARAWSALGACYREQQPGLAQYALERAYRLQPDAEHARALAYQDFANRDYAGAMAIWRGLPPEALREADLLAAADTAIEAGQGAEARSWLDAYAERVGSPGDRYWSLRARVRNGDDAAAVADLRQAIRLRPDPDYFLRLADLERLRSHPQAELDALLRAQSMRPHDAVLAQRIGYAYLRQERIDSAIAQFERARIATPGDPVPVRELMYLSRQRGDRDQAQRYAALAIDRIDADAGAPSGVARDAARDPQRFALRRLHEEMGRRWSVDADLILGDTLSSAANPIAPGVSYRSYFQAEAQYRFGDAWPRIGGGGLAAYARVFAGSGQEGDLWPTHAPMLGAGVHWQPWRSRNLVMTLERQQPLDHHPYTRSDTMARVSYSTAFRDRYNQDWHPAKRTWATQNLYLDLAHYFAGRQTVVTADYRLGLHRRVAPGQTVEPYAHVQFNGLERGRGRGFGRDVRVGAGLRWNLWYGQSRYDAYRHRFSIGLEVQHAFTSYLHERNAVYLTVGKHW